MPAAGDEVELTVVYLSRAWAWEEALPEALRAEVQPEEPSHRRDAGKLRQAG